MSKTVKAFAKINIALNVVGVSDGYHNLDSVVTTVNKYNLVKASKRRDNKILISFTGKYGFIPEKQEETNAYKAAELFIKTFNTTGANIEIKSNLITSSGMGGSSVDVVGVLGAMQKLYKTDADLKPLADSLGSDSGYLLKGGYARLLSRGEEVRYFDSDVKLYFVVIYEDGGVNTKACFDSFDGLGINGNVSNIDSVVEALESGNLDLLDGNVENALCVPAIAINGEVEKNLNALKSLSPRWATMTGSGATVFAVYENVEMALWAEEKLKSQGFNAEMLESYSNKDAKFFDILFDRIIK